MNSSPIHLAKIFPFALICGVIGGCLLIARYMLTNWGWGTLLIYALVMVITMVLLRFNERIKANYLTALTAGTLTFMIMSIILYCYILLFRGYASDITILGHALRLAAMLGIALASSALLGLLFIRRGGGLKQT